MGDGIKIDPPPESCVVDGLICNREAGHDGPHECYTPPAPEPCQVETVDRTDSAIGPPFLYYAKCECGYIGHLREAESNAETDARVHRCDAPPPTPEPPAEPAKRETFLAIRRTDGERIFGEFWWMEAPSDDPWRGWEPESDVDECPVEYEAVRMIVEPVARRTYTSPHEFTGAPPPAPEPVGEVCPRCDGERTSALSDAVPCPKCGGAGVMPSDGQPAPEPAEVDACLSTHEVDGRWVVCDRGDGHAGLCGAVLSQTETEITQVTWMRRHYPVTTPAPEPPAEVDPAPSISDEMLAAADAIETLHLRHDGGAKMRRKVAAQLREWAALAAHDAEVKP